MKREYVITIMLLAMLVACSVPVIMGQCPCPPGDPVDACKPGVATGPCPCYCGTSGTVVNGTVHVEYSQPNTKIASMTFNVPEGDIKWARVYWHIWGGSASKDGWTNATFCNATDYFNCNQYIPPVNSTNCNQTECCGYYMGGSGTHWVYWNVTDCITAGSNSLSVDNSNSALKWDGRIYQMKLVAVVENMTEFPSDVFPTTNYWINQGFQTLDLAYTTWFNGNINQRNCTLWHYALANHEMNISFNDHDVEIYPNIGDDWYDELVELIPAGIVELDGSQNMTWSLVNDDPHLVEAILVDNDYYFKPDLMVEDKKIEHLNYTSRYLLHQTPTTLNLSDPVDGSDDWYECWPIDDRLWDLTNWTDTQPDGNLSKGDIINMTDGNGNVTWYHVDKLAFRISVISTTTAARLYLDSKSDCNSSSLTNPNGFWRETSPSYGTDWQITNWYDNNTNGIVDCGDQVYMGIGSWGSKEWYNLTYSQWPKADSVLIAMSVTELCAPCYNYSCYCQTPKEFVANHTYDVDVLIKNDGGGDSGAFCVTLYEWKYDWQTSTMAWVGVDTRYVNGLGSGANNNTKWVRFQWHPITSGSNKLKVMADSYNEVEELRETNNDIEQYEMVLSSGGLPDLDAYPCCIDFSPAWMSNATDITVTVLNNGTGDACCFTVNVTMTSDCGDTNYPWSDCVTTSVCAKASKDITFTSPELTRCCNYTVTVRLDPGNTSVVESIETNNNETKVFHAIHTKLKVTHHYGNMSTYNGVLSGHKPVEMFELHKIVTNYTTPYKLLTSEADVLDVGMDGDIDGINRSCAASPGTSTWYLNRSTSEDPECPSDRPIYWYLFVNGIPTPDMPSRMYDYTFEDCEVMHIDLLKYVNSGSETTNPFRPRPIMDFPEPFLHGGYDGLVADTTIVHPDDPAWLTIANNIKTNLVSNCGIPAERINISTDTAVGNRKNTDHLILIGTPLDNSLIVSVTDGSVNANHTEIGMPMYFDTSNPNAIRLYDDWLYNGDDPDVPDCCSKKNSSYHSVVMACDNPFPNALPWTDTWKDDDLTMWIASGVTDWYAKDAANMLTLGCDQSLWDDKGFWYKTRKCADVDGNGYSATSSDRYAILDWNICTSEWAADVDGNGYSATSSDRYAILDWNLNCCTC